VCPQWTVDLLTVGCVDVELNKLFVDIAVIDYVAELNISCFDFQAALLIEKVTDQVTLQ